MRPRPSHVVLAGLAALALAACSSTDDPTAAPISAPTAPAPAAPGAPATPAPPAAPATSTAPSPGDAGASRDTPAPVDTPVRVGDWEIEVGATNSDATQEIADENMFNQAPEEGFTYVLVPITATYLGTERVSPWLEIGVRYVGNDATTYDGYCGVVPDQFLDAGEVYEGGTATGNVCAPVRTEAIEGGVWIIEEQLNVEQDTARYFASG